MTMSLLKSCPPQKLTFETHKDQRGSLSPFSWTWTDQFRPCQFSYVESKSAVVRGLHSQRFPFEQKKMLFVLEGKIRDVMVEKSVGSLEPPLVFQFDLNPGEGVLVPPNYFHGYSALAEKVKVLYLLDYPFAPETEISIYPYDPTLNINWGILKENAIMSDKDKMAMTWGKWLEST